MIDQIITDPSILRQPSALTTLEEVMDLNLEQRLKTICEHAWTPGMGLAAIQMGIPLRFAWYRWGDQDFTLLNPVITRYRARTKPLREGCLSIPDNWVAIRRYFRINYESHGEPLTAKGDRAHVIQHEVDHMNGILNIDAAAKGKR
jgi:peptide deformylase